jgi:2-hydroxychromene-2-carboxylate isomerase
VYLSEAISGDFQPAPDMLAEYAIKDCKNLALELGIPFLDKGALPPTEFRAGMSDAIASSIESETFAEELFQALAVYWRGDTAAAAQISSVAKSKGAGRQVAQDSQKLLQNMGHYGSAMLNYGGEWYWGADRLNYLTSRLDELGAANDDASGALLVSLRQARQVALPVRPPSAAKDLPAIEFFTSFRSPYSYLALRRTFEIADAFGIKVKLRPVLPMVARGMQVPRAKLVYIAGDAVREAERTGVPFGSFVDPLGTAVERSMAVFTYAESEQKGRDFLIQAGTAVWAEGIDVATDKGMRKVTGRCGLFWPDVVDVMERDDWREKAGANRESMTESGSWGVPTMRLGDFVVWGQDRDWLLVRHIEELCDTGDGILV